MQSDGRFILHRFIGDEVYRIQDAVMCTNPGEDGGVMLWFDVQTESPALQTQPDTEALRARPSAEVAIPLPSVDLDQLVGRTFSVPSAYDEVLEDHVATFYYFEHEDLNENEVTILKRKGSSFHVRWTASATDLAYYDDSQPRMQVEIDGWFRYTEKDNPNCA
jgi:hypothetical protein